MSTVIQDEPVEGIQTQTQTTYMGGVRERMTMIASSFNPPPDGSTSYLPLRLAHRPKFKIIAKVL